MGVGCESLSNSRKVREHVAPTHQKLQEHTSILFCGIYMFDMIIDFKTTFLHHFLRLIRLDMSNKKNSEQTLIRTKFSCTYWELFLCFSIFSRMTLYHPKMYSCWNFNVEASVLRNAKNRCWVILSSFWSWFSLRTTFGFFESQGGVLRTIQCISAIFKLNQSLFRIFSFYFVLHLWIISAMVEINNEWYVIVHICMK